MHILVTNDDGPPSNQSSPYVHTLISQLQSAGHTVSVVLPHVQRSWIGKAHMVGQAITPTYYRPGAVRRDSTGALNNQGTTSKTPLAGTIREGEEGDDEPHQDEWVLIDSTPASCVQIGLHHFFESRGPIDLVVSGPNYGRNTTACFSLSSGTLGGAMEAAVCGKRAIALSYAFFDKNHDPEIVAGASRISVKIIENLAANWKPDVHVYTVNVPLVEGVEQKKVLWTRMLQNTWTSGSCFQEVEVPDEGEKVAEDADKAEVEIRESEEGEAPTSMNGKKPKAFRYKHKHFKWAPKITDVYESVERGGPGSDGWVVKEKDISVTPLRANFMHVDGFEGELKL
ncbi:sure-like protein [Pseudovirgaria hyperparasitica]|uniref:Sure-like protein n=1 Tax=Pseudovirgaria hyperparasitica TaxID=470096 RepID=A0A6A6W7V4_9PEZI|nr:sure-like protein [Pseudovirgaria hyperparasitica]KAF2758978.1 sure-like protein [Pseudovirgaria hyperparasitica]